MNNMYRKVPRIYFLRSRPHKFSKARQFSVVAKDEHIVKSCRPDLEIPHVTVPEFIFEKWTKFTDRVALECVVTGKKYTFEELRRKSLNLSAAFKTKLHLKKGDVVAVVLPNTPDYAVCVLGALQAGLIVTTLTPLYTAEEIRRQLLETEAKAIITSPTLLPVVQRSHNGLPIISIKEKSTDSLPNGVILFDDLTTETQTTDFKSTDADDVAILPASSGTTGFPKAVELTHRSIVTNICQFNEPTYDDVVTSTEDYQAVIAGILPFFHVAGLVTSLFSSLTHMSKLVTLPKFQPELYINTLKEYKPHFMIVVPYIVGLLTNSPNVPKEYFERMKIIGSSTAPLSQLDEERLRQKVGGKVDIVQGYGMTETTALVTLNTKDSSDYTCSGSVGKPLQNTFIKVVDQDGKSLGPNTPGEILIKGPQLMKGYHNKPKQTQEVFVDGWLRSGDIGYYNEKNLFFVTERIKELIKVKGFQVAPAEIEAILRDHPHVQEAAVVGIPHSTFGEVPRAYIVLKENTKSKAEEIEAFVAKKVANYKQLKGGVAFIETLPKGPSGKILRKALKDNYKENLS